MPPGPVSAGLSDCYGGGRTARSKDPGAVGMEWEVSEQGSESGGLQHVDPTFTGPLASRSPGPSCACRPAPPLPIALTGTAQLRRGAQLARDFTYAGTTFRNLAVYAPSTAACRPQFYRRCLLPELPLAHPDGGTGATSAASWTCWIWQAASPAGCRADDMACSILRPHISSATSGGAQPRETDLHAHIADCKLAACAVTSRMGPLLKEDVDATTQAAFLPNRWSGSNVLAHLEEVAYLKETRQPAVMLYWTSRRPSTAWIGPGSSAAAPPWAMDRGWSGACASCKQIFSSAVGYGPGAGAVRALPASGSARVSPAGKAHRLPSQWSLGVTG